MLLLGDVPALVGNLFERTPDKPRQRPMHRENLPKLPQSPAEHPHLNVGASSTVRYRVLLVNEALNISYVVLRLSIGCSQVIALN